MRQSWISTTTDPLAQAIDAFNPEVMGSVPIIDGRLGRLARKLASDDEGRISDERLGKLATEFGCANGINEEPDVIGNTRDDLGKKNVS